MLAISMGLLFQSEADYSPEALLGSIADTLASVVGRFRVKRRCGLWPRFAQDRCAIVQGALRDFAAGLQNDELLAGDQGEHRVRRGLGVLDEVAVDGERAAVESCQFDHVWSSFRFSHRQRVCHQ